MIWLVVLSMSNHLFVCQLTFSNFEKSAGNFIATEKEKLVTQPELWNIAIRQSYKFILGRKE